MTDDLFDKRQTTNRLRLRLSLKCNKIGPGVKVLLQAAEPQRRPMESIQQKQLRLERAESRNVRSLSGWNVFQRERLGGQQFSMAEYQSKVSSLSKEWRGLGSEQKEDFQVQAVHEQQVRHRVSEAALKPKKQLEPDRPELQVTLSLEEEVGKKGLSKISAKRLAINKELYHSHPLWSSPSQMGDGSL